MVWQSNDLSYSIDHGIYWGVFCWHIYLYPSQERLKKCWNPKFVASWNTKYVKKLLKYIEIRNTKTPIGPSLLWSWFAKLSYFSLSGQTQIKRSIWGWSHLLPFADRLIKWSEFLRLFGSGFNLLHTNIIPSLQIA